MRSLEIQIKKKVIIGVYEKEKKVTQPIIIDIKKPMAIKNADYAGCSVLFESTEDILKTH